LLAEALAECRPVGLRNAHGIVIGVRKQTL
jgi:hypothetical protein